MVYETSLRLFGTALVNVETSESGRVLTALTDGLIFGATSAHTSARKALLLQIVSSPKKHSNQIEFEGQDVSQLVP
jgi:hypothetical protein